MCKKQLENKINIQMFAHFKVSGMGAVLDEDSIRSDMLTKLLAYIICNCQKEISTQELVDILWQDEESDNPAGALKNLVYRLRTIMKKTWKDCEFILTGRGSYRWNPQVVLETDAQQFEQLCQEASKDIDTQVKIEKYLKALDFYKGMFLPKISGEYWIASLSTYYHSLYLSAVKTTAALLEKTGRYEEMEHMCSNALQLDNLDESLHYYFVKALLRQNKLKLAAKQYKKAVDILYENLGVTPSEELRAVYEELLKQTHEEEKSIRVIQQELNDDNSPGAFLCEYGVFKKTYHLEKRRAERMGISVYILLITVVPTLNVKVDSQAYLDLIHDAMEHLEYVLLHSLRSGDVISKYSGTQYVILLPTCQYEAAKRVVERILSAYESLSKKN